MRVNVRSSSNRYRNGKPMKPTFRANIGLTLDHLSSGVFGNMAELQLREAER
jgi:hypothetical protein